jgi:hypothetical protein
MCFTCAIGLPARRLRVKAVSKIRLLLMIVVVGGVVTAGKLHGGRRNGFLDGKNNT